MARFSGSGSVNVRPSIQNKVEVLYRACQDFATDEIEKLTSEVVFDFTLLSNDWDLK
jgi:hypothetical protein